MSKKEKKVEEEEQVGGFPGMLYDWLEIFAICLVPIILLFIFVGQPVVVEGSSMVPTLHDRDLMAVQRIGYTPRQGDVVILNDPFLNITSPIVKRVIAVGGQTVDIDYVAGTVSVDGKVLSEPYINYEPMERPWYVKEDATHITVPEGSVFVMGDNRNHSTDSRHEELGPVDTRRIIGHALAVMFPFGDMGAIE